MDFLKAQENKVFVQGTFIDAISVAINAFHRTPHYTLDFYKKLQYNKVDYDEII